MVPGARDYEIIGYEDMSKLHQAFRTLGANDSDLVIAGACQLLLAPDESMSMACYTFDDRGTGYGRGEGVVYFVLKRLDRALADGDPVHAIVVESGSNQNGKTSGSSCRTLTPKQTESVLSIGRLVSTRLRLRDDVEVNSMAENFGREKGRKSQIAIVNFPGHIFSFLRPRNVLPFIMFILGHVSATQNTGASISHGLSGSIKANIGHVERTSGVAGLGKTIMLLKKDLISPQLNFINPKPGYNLKERDINVLIELMPLTPESHVVPNNVSIDSFGYGRTNAYIILDKYDPALIIKGYANGHTSKQTD
ncbi:putative Polyketide synthase [Seiridium cardinale]|uniref:Polyketide synthase n=1 Tax=Seiridium cardinale TaxID=138064 RepID=A0ABR2XNT5_9PEZI